MRWSRHSPFKPLRLLLEASWYAGTIRYDDTESLAGSWGARCIRGRSVSRQLKVRIWVRGHRSAVDGHVDLSWEVFLVYDGKCWMGVVEQSTGYTVQVGR
jgi:hypothetical protein